MVFRAKVDMFLLILIFLVVSIMGTIPLLSLYKELPFPVLLIIVVIFIIAAAFVWWYGTSIQYVFYKEYLLIKGGLFKRRIPYQHITKVSPTTENTTGYKSTIYDKAIELCLESTSFGSIKILPEDKLAFIEELKKRCPNLQIQNFE
ncbi:PH domain-containing protein [Lysinibacillus sp. NPDC097279]|uniref:PH domain-containing protein n=1 Tax=Lysinibacillus sp. NPDC097279 TaxID=3364143 RepID=UPI00382D06ED